MITVFALLAAPLSAPPPQQLPGLVSVEDYPPTALDRGEQGPVYVQVLINPDGRVDSCTVLLSSGYNDLDDATCRLVTARVRFSPAQNESGKAIYGTYRQVINWRIANRGLPIGPGLPPEIPPDLDLTISQAPPGVKLPMRFAVRFLIKADGTASRCDFSNDWVSRPQVLPPKVLVDLACQAVMQSAVRPVRNHENEPIEVSDGATVRFSVKR
jgi:TonB family protein